MKFITVPVFLLSLVLYSSVFVSPEIFRFAGLLPFFIPVILIVNIFLFAVLALSWRRLAFFPLAALLIGYKFLLISFQIHPRNEDAEGLKVLTYNAHSFFYRKKKTDQLDPNVFTWLAEHPADIKSFQEFYQDNTSSTRNALKFLTKDGEYEHVYHIVDGNPQKRSQGMAIFSRYPILNHGVVFDNQVTNGAIFADIQVGNDTLRIYNAHLESMAIETGSLNDYDRAQQVYRQTLGKLHRGSLARAQQLSMLYEHINNSPHPVILMGDLNEVPYSYVYFRLSEKLDNAFEEAGRGFEFTYNRILFFLRIDHIFADPSLKPVYFNTHREVDYSDHYPVSATFTWEGMK
ncbi:endonuclease/exonuclease/phosphatase family protein [Algoriphagus aestuariicola]|uniref:Endonuclease/exonuclease/phosphatase family protein n=1 Tax=Algoriphagus aestuariicola TaxID=1852016 RepID=A0ABS3BNQ9_9BACT|nr:endonuclease/exonuclease/phosphatase family protein [Algoriphagus aestuariicola]MBN7799881.1 endonuclease/exonuclease/phosphatase family protein [Algoriphagus aestuariicola]